MNDKAKITERNQAEVAEENQDNVSEFRKDLKDLINRHSLENGSDTPDFVLAEYLSGCLLLFDSTVRRREKLRNRT